MQVMGGIAAEASNNGKAEGGQSDESALIQLLAGLDGGKSWDLPRVQNQARGTPKYLKAPWTAPERS